MSHTLRHARLLFGAVLAVLALGLVPTAAHADSALIDSLDTTGKTDWVTGVPRTFVVSATTRTPLRIYIKYRETGPTPCARTAATDTGTYWGYAWDLNDPRTVNGSVTYRDVFSTSLSGTKLFCIWLAGSTTTEVTPIAQTVTFRAPTGTVSGTVDPLTPAPKQPATLTVTGATEAPERVYVKVRAAGTPCAATASADPGTDVLDDDGERVDGNYTVSATVTQSTPGSYVACVWVAGSGSDPVPTAGPQAVPFTVAAPAPPPVVAPPVAKGPSVECAAATKRIHKAAKRVKTTKRKLLRAKHRSTRRKLTRRIRVQRRTLRARIKTAKTICG